MCSKCEKIHEAVARYKRLKAQIDDHQLHEAADRLVAKLLAEELTLHPKE